MKTVGKLQHQGSSDVLQNNEFGKEFLFPNSGISFADIVVLV
jgi:hypothetical protein